MMTDELAKALNKWLWIFWQTCSFLTRRGLSLTDHNFMLLRPLAKSALDGIHLNWAPPIDTAKEHCFEV
jgi:hypothetical protein